MAMSKTSGLFNYNFKRFKCFSFSICIAIPSLSSSAASLFMLRNILNNSSFLSFSISELRLLISFLPFTTFMRIYPNEFVFDESKIGKNNKSFFSIHNAGIILACKKCSDTIYWRLFPFSRSIFLLLFSGSQNNIQV